MRRLIGILIYTCSQIRLKLRLFYWRSRLGSLGQNSNIYSMARIYSPRKVHIGKNVTINDFVHIWGGGRVTIGDDTLIAAHTVITSQTHDTCSLDKGMLYRQTNLLAPVTIGSNVWIGSGVIILPGIAIGDGSIVGAGSVVTKDIPKGTLVIGSPAKIIRDLQPKQNTRVAQ